MKKDMAKNKPIILTFDYELFLGANSGTAERCVLQPTNRILDLFERYSACGVFFIDATYLLTLAKCDHRDLTLIASQLQRMIRLGCNVELHLHPQWLDAYPLDSERWTFHKFDRYRLHSLQEGEISHLFTAGLNILHGIVRDVNPAYTVSGFRAGGWSISPFEKLRALFIENRIIYDSSVSPGWYRNALPCHYYDFRDAPRNLPIWRFQDEPCNVDERGRFVELPVTTYEANLADLVINRWALRNIDYCGDGAGLATRGMLESIRKAKLFTTKQLTVDMCSKYLFMKSLEATKDKLRVFASHPKTLCEVSFLNLEYLLANYRTASPGEAIEECCAS